MGEGARPDDGRATRYDVVVAGGEVVDPAAGIVGRHDVAIRDGRVAAVAPRIPTEQAERVIEASGQIVTPGLVDLHTHVYWGATYWGIEADPVAARTGVTTWLDVGSSGAYNWPGFRRYVAEASRSRVFALLNLSSIGLVARTFELSNLDYCDVDLAAQVVDLNRDLILGVKARIDASTTRGVGIRPLELARELADRVDLPLMVHISSGPPSIDEVVALLRPGDILTHCFTGGNHRIVDADGRPRADVRRLHEAGLILDIGHGTGSFSYDVAEAMLDQGLLPDVISSDIHQLSVQGPMYDLPTTLSKFLNLGVSLPDVVERATARPGAPRRGPPHGAPRPGGGAHPPPRPPPWRPPDLGTLRPGSVADLALFRIEEGEYTFRDAQMAARGGSRRLVNTLTLVGGEELPRAPERPCHVWAVLPAHQRPAAAEEPR